MDDALLREQIEYYRERAAEYDDWWLRRGSYDLAPALREQWFADVAQSQSALGEFEPSGDVLELACGTGLWTEQLVRYADRVTAVDSSPEVIELNRSRLPGAQVRYMVGDVFGWRPPRAAFDAVVFAYWLSHVPDDRLASFWDGVRRTLRPLPGGRVFLVDSAPYPGAPPPGGRAERRG